MNSKLWFERPACWDCHQAGGALSLALRRIDPTIKPIAFDRRLQRLAQQAHRRPYIFTEQEVRQLFAAARSSLRRNHHCDR